VRDAGGGGRDDAGGGALGVSAEKQILRCAKDDKSVSNVESCATRSCGEVARNTLGGMAFI
jgi:hypothetical protein